MWSEARVCVMTVLAMVAFGGTSGGAQNQNTTWPGTITLTATFNGVEAGRKVTYRRVERWEKFVVTGGEADGSTASFDSVWSIDLIRKEVTADCTTTIAVHGRAPYPWFTFELNPLDEKSYHLYSAGTGDGGPSAKGTALHACRNQQPTTMPYEVEASWLTATPFVPPAELLPPGVEQPKVDAAALGPLVAGTLDPARPNLVSGTARGQAQGKGPIVTLRWSLSRSGECDEAEARQLVAHESGRLAAVDTAPSGPPADDSAARGLDAAATTQSSAAAAPPSHISSNQPLSQQAVAAALTGALGLPDVIAIRESSGTDAAGLRRFAVRLNADRHALPSLASLQQQIETTCVAPGSIEAAPVLLLGSVQWTGDQFRVNLRTVNTESAAVIATATDSGVGGAAELQGAIESALSSFIMG